MHYINPFSTYLLTYRPDELDFAKKTVYERMDGWASSLESHLILRQTT